MVYSIEGKVSAKANIQTVYHFKSKLISFTSPAIGTIRAFQTAFESSVCVCCCLVGLLSWLYTQVAGRAAFGTNIWKLHLFCPKPSTFPLSHLLTAEGRKGRKGGRLNRTAYSFRSIQKTKTGDGGCKQKCKMCEANIKSIRKAATNATKSIACLTVRK